MWLNRTGFAEGLATHTVSSWSKNKVAEGVADALELPCALRLPLHMRPAILLYDELA